MKKLFPIAIVAVFGLLSFASCSKKSTTSSTCTCKYPSPFTTHDTTVSFSNAGTYSSVTAACSAADSVYKLIGTGYGCHM